MPYVSTAFKKTFEIEKIVTIHFFEYPPDFYFQGESHDFWEFVFVDSGAAEIGADEKCFLLEPGKAIFHKPMEFHTLKSANGTAPSLLIFSFVCNSPAIKLFENKVVELDETQRGMLSSIKSEAESCFSTPINVPAIERILCNETVSVGAEQVIQNLLELFLISIARKEDNAFVNHVATASLPVSIQGKNSLLIKQVLNYFVEHIYESLTIKQIASDNLIGRSRLQEIFNQEFHCGVMQIFTEMKITRAKELIRKKKLSLKEISDMLDYNDISHFSKTFKKVVGYAPSIYARSIKSIGENAASVSPRTRALLFYEELN